MWLLFSRHDSTGCSAIPPMSSQIYGEIIQILSLSNFRIRIRPLIIPIKDLPYLVLQSPAGRFVIGETLAGPMAALVRVYGAPTRGPFRVSLRLNNSEVCGFGVFQAE